MDKDDHLKHMTRALITVMHAIADKSTFQDQNISRKDIVANDKMEAEGAAEEKKICLGWLLKSRELSVTLPSHKAIAWSSQIDNSLSNATLSNKELQSILGRLENVAQIMIPLVHFLGNIRHMQILAEKRGHSIRLNSQTKDDLKLAKNLISKAAQGVTMNLLIFRTPDITYICDASEYGVGGFASHGRA